MVSVRSSIEESDPFIVGNGTKNIVFLHLLHFADMLQTAFENVKQSESYVSVIVLNKWWASKQNLRRLCKLFVTCSLQTIAQL